MTSRSLDLFLEVFASLPRQGPGSYDCTRRALSMCAELPESPRVLDLGCGAGAQTFHLASMTSASILAIDAHPPLVERLRAQIDEHALADRVEVRVGDMADLDLAPQSFDLVWSEGALYSIGLESALPICARLLRPGGLVAFTDAVWRSANPPEDVRQAFADYPTMGRVEDVLGLLDRQQWQLLGHFDLPQEAWWDDFYTPMEAQLRALGDKYAGDSEALQVLEEIAAEPQMHRQSGHHYGYTFFVARRP